MFRAYFIGSGCQIRAHNPKVAGSNPAPAIEKPLIIQGFSCLSGRLRGRGLCGVYFDSKNSRGVRTGRPASVSSRRCASPDTTHSARCCSRVRSCSWGKHRESRQERDRGRLALAPSLDGSRLCGLRHGARGSGSVLGRRPRSSQPSRAPGWSALPNRQALGCARCQLAALMTSQCQSCRRKLGRIPPPGSVPQLPQSIFILERARLSRRDRRRLPSVCDFADTDRAPVLRGTSVMPDL